MTGIDISTEPWALSLFTVAFFAFVIVVAAYSLVCEERQIRSERRSRNRLRAELNNKINREESENK